MEHPLATAAEAAIEDDDIERRPTYCYRAFRQIRQKLYGAIYDKYDDDSDRPTAKKAEARWRTSPFVVDQKKGTLIGDVFFYGDRGPDGHIGIRVAGNRIMDNSESSHGRINGAKGYRAMADLGKPTLVIRLPRPAKKRSLKK